jgi:hypothetical protein
VRVFADRLPGVAEVRGRRTCRANAIARLIGYALGGRAGERLAERLGLPISNDSLLRRVKTGAQPAVTGTQVIGIDEWAKRKGRTYGTIVVDLERHTVVDVLDQHSSEAVEQWLVAHPDVQTICRDRNGRYARAARLAAPAVTQVTDRFHLVQNLRETIERELALHRAYLRVRVTVNGRPDTPPLDPSIERPVGAPVARERRLLPARRLALQTEIRRQLRQTHQQLFDTFKTLQATGMPIGVIAQRLGCNRRRLDKWAKQSQLPARQKMHPSPGSAETFREFLRQRWDAGCRNGRALVDELRVRGYQGTYKAVGKILSPWRVGNVAFEQATDDLTMPAPPPPVLTDPTQRQISPQIAATLLTTPRPELTPGKCANRRRVKSGLSRLRRDALADDGLPSAAETVPVSTGPAGAIRDCIATVDGPCACQRHCSDPELRGPVAAGHSGGGSGGDDTLEQRARRGPGESPEDAEAPDVRPGRRGAPSRPADPTLN